MDCHHTYLCRSGCGSHQYLCRLECPRDLIAKWTGANHLAHRQPCHTHRHMYKFNFSFFLYHKYRQVGIGAGGGLLYSTGNRAALLGHKWDYCGLLIIGRGRACSAYCSGVITPSYSNIRSYNYSIVYLVHSSSKARPHHQHPFAYSLDPHSRLPSRSSPGLAPSSPLHASA